MRRIVQLCKSRSNAVDAAFLVIPFPLTVDAVGINRGRSTSRKLIALCMEHWMRWNSSESDGFAANYFPVPPTSFNMIHAQCAAMCGNIKQEKPWAYCPGLFVKIRNLAATYSPGP